MYRDQLSLYDNDFSINFCISPIVDVQKHLPLPGRLARSDVKK